MKIYKLIPFKNLRHKLRDRYSPREIKIDKSTRCLVVAPHPDDEMIGVGGLMSLYNVMAHLGIKNHWIYQTYGLNGIEQMKAMFKDYIQDLKTRNYDYIFLPVPHDRHQDHNYIVSDTFL